MAGQYLDVLEGAIAKSDRERSLKIANLKSGKYSIERPLHFGAALAGASNEVFEIYSGFGLPLGQAFQLRDDLLGVFGDSKVTGKPSGDDIREGKRTVLIAMAIEKSDTGAIEILERSLGNQGLTDLEISKIQEIIEESGARQDCENLIDRLFESALQSLESPKVNQDISIVLQEMASLATKRSS